MTLVPPLKQSPPPYQPKALYYSIMQYSPENRRFLDKFFNVIELADPCEDTSDILSKIEVLFAPLGFVVDENKMRSCPNLRAIVSNTTGIPHIDDQTAAARDIAVCALHDEQAFLDTITPTAEHTIGLMLTVWRQIPAAHAAAVSGQWNRRPWGAPAMMSRMCLGIVGLGRIGRKVATIAAAMGMQVVFYDPYVPGGCSDLVTLAKQSNIISLHAPANTETQGLITRQVLEALPAGAMLINTARGELLDEGALLEQLKSGHLRGAALDTIDGEYAPEFLDAFLNHPLVKYARDHSNLILTPHIGGSTYDAWFETERFVIEKALKALKIRYADNGEIE